MENIETYLGGSGHFAFGFVIGYGLFQWLLKFRYNNLFSHLYGPFIPLLTGIWAVLPYGFNEVTNGLSTWLNIFFFYTSIHFNEYIIAFLGRAAFAATFCGFLFILILMHYIRLFKYCKVHGWANEVTNAR